jgi:hypothetical protein
MGFGQVAHSQRTTLLSAMQRKDCQVQEATGEHEGNQHGAYREENPHGIIPLL